MSFIDSVLKPIPIPRFVKVAQTFPRPIISNIEEYFSEELLNNGVLSTVLPGMRIAITGGSRGISDLPLILRLLVFRIKSLGAFPFIFPAMGSHGGATASGQLHLLDEMGITEDYMGCPIRSDMETIIIGNSQTGLPVHVDKLAFEADAIIPVNRIKPHVGFRGKYESGLIKMMAIGLGKQKGAETYHNLGFGQMGENIKAAAELCISHCNIPFGIAILENPYHETCGISVIPKDQIMEKEPHLLDEVRKMTPRIFINPLDVVVLDEIGKDISGVGYDSHVLGRFHTPFITPEPGSPQITRIITLDLTDATHGNGNGLGNLDFTTRRVFEKFSFEETYPNCLTSTVPVSVKIPMVLNNDRQAIQAAIRTCNIADSRNVRMVRLKNTLEIGEIEISENLIFEAEACPNMTILSKPYHLSFNVAGDLF